MNTSSIRSGDNLARSSAAPITWEPSLWALNDDRSPIKRPSGVRAAETMTTGSEAVAMADAPWFRARTSGPQIELQSSYDALRNLQRGRGINCREVALQHFPLHWLNPSRRPQERAPQDEVPHGEERVF